MPYKINDIASNVEIVMMPVNEIIPYWRNPRRNDKTVDALCETIPVHGFNVPIVVDRNNVVVKGHARLRAAKRLGMEQVPCIVSDAPEDIIKADRIADNKIQELSAWDFGKLNFELAKHETPVFNRLFRPEENPVAEDGFDAEAVDFKPVGIGEYDFEGSEDSAQPYDDFSGSGYNPGTAEYTPVVGGSETPQQVNGASFENSEKVAATTGPRQCKTLCPYCGKIVMVTV